MKRFCCLMVLMLLSSSAWADSISFSVGGHRIRIEAARNCRSSSCASVSVSGLYESRRRHDRNDDDDRDTAAPPPPAPPAPPQVSPPAVPPQSKPVVETTAAAPPPPVFKPAASVIQPIAAPPPPVQLPKIPPPPAEKPAEIVRPAPAIAPPVIRVSQEAQDEPDDTPVGDWQTEGKGSVRIAPCGRALCGNVLNSSSNDKGEAVLINMKPKTDSQWSGNVYSHDSGDTYYGTMDMRGPNTLRVEACALGKFYCSRNNWTRISGRLERLISSRQVSPEPRS